VQNWSYCANALPIIFVF